MNSDTVQRICEALLRGKHEDAKNIARKCYPFESRSKPKRRHTKLQMMDVFLRDGFIDRYSGSKLVHSAVLRLLTLILPDEFPFHKNWKMSETHMVFWELFPTIDHIVPVARGGSDDERNLASTSMLRNGAKGQWTLDELKWKVMPPGDLSNWDGLTGWLLQYVDENREMFSDSYLRSWHRATVAAKIGAGGTP